MGALGGLRELLRSTAGEGPATGGGDNQPVYQPPARAAGIQVGRVGGGDFGGSMNPSGREK